MGTLLTSIIVMGLLLALPSILRADSSVNHDSMNVTELVSVYRQALIDPFNKAASEVRDPQIAAFTKKLVDIYELNKTGSNVDDKSGLSDLLPDIAKIHKSALNMPLKEAGRQIEDNELSEFYNRFITNCGVDR